VKLVMFGDLRIPEDEHALAGRIIGDAARLLVALRERGDAAILRGTRDRTGATVTNEPSGHRR